MTAPMCWRSGAGTLSGNAGHHRPGDRERFFYDFFRNEPFTPEDFAPIEKKMREIIQRDKPFTKSVKTREEAKEFFRNKGEMFKVELVDAIPGNEDIKFYDQGGWINLCRGRT